MFTAIHAIKPFLRSLLRDERGASAIEYGLIAALIAAVIIVTVGSIGQELLGAFETILDELGGGA